MAVFPPQYFCICHVGELCAISYKVLRYSKVFIYGKLSKYFSNGKNVIIVSSYIYTPSPIKLKLGYFIFYLMSMSKKKTKSLKIIVI